MPAVRILSVGNVYPPHDFGGGYERVWVGANAHLRARGHRLRVLCSDHRSPDVTEQREDEVHRELRWYWRDHSFPRVSPVASLGVERHNRRVLERHLAELEPELILWWSMGGLSIGLLETAGRRGLPALALVHDDWLDYGRRADAWYRRSSRLPGWIARLIEPIAGVPIGCDFDRAARYLFVSRHTCERARASGLTVADAGVLHSGIDPGLLEGPTDREWAWRILCVGRIEERKGTRTAIEALSRLPAEASLTLVGDGDPGTLVSLRAEAEALGVAGRVEFAGRCAPDAVRGHYDDADAVVFPVVWEEPWGLVPLEAMARRRPVVASGSGGSGEYLRDRENCLLAPGSRPDRLAEALLELAADRSLRERLVAAGRGLAAEHTADRFNEGLAAEVELQSSGERAPTAPSSSEASPTRSPAA